MFRLWVPGTRCYTGFRGFYAAKVILVCSPNARLSLVGKSGRRFQTNLAIRNVERGSGQRRENERRGSSETGFRMWRISTPPPDAEIVPGFHILLMRVTQRRTNYNNFEETRGMGVAKTVSRIVKNKCSWCDDSLMFLTFV